MSDSIEEDIEQRIANRLRQARHDRGLTLAEVAEDAGLSLGYLSRLESGARRPSVGSMVVLAGVLGLGLSELLADPGQQDVVIIRKGSQSRHPRPEGIYTHVSGSLPNGMFEVLEIELHPSRRRTPDKSHRGEEWLYVLEGHAQLELDETSYELSAGDAAHYSALRPHRISTQDPVARVLICIAAPTTSRVH